MSAIPQYFTQVVAAPFNSHVYLSGYTPSQSGSGSLYEFNRVSF